jgi:hypothetical protein
MMSVYRGRPEVAFQGREDRFDPAQSLLLTCAEDPSATQLLSANRVTFRHHFAIPIRPETGRLMEVWKPHDNESEKARHDQSK